MYKPVTLIQSDGDLYLIPNDLKDRFIEIDGIISLGDGYEEYHEACEEFDRVFKQYQIRGKMPQLYIEPASKSGLENSKDLNEALDSIIETTGQIRAALERMLEKL